MGDAAANAVRYALLCVAFPAAIAVGLRVPGLIRRGRQVVVRPAPPPPVGPPIELLAADLRRVRRELALVDASPQLPGRVHRRQALRLAYLDALRVMCEELEIPPPQAGPDGDVPAAEIDRTEARLAGQGMDLRPPP